MSRADPLSVTVYPRWKRYMEEQIASNNNLTFINQVYYNSWFGTSFNIFSGDPFEENRNAYWKYLGSLSGEKGSNPSNGSSGNNGGGRNSGSGGSNGYGSGGGNSFDVTFNNEYSSSNYDNNYQPSQESINREMMPARNKNTRESNNSYDSDSTLMRIAKGTSYAVMATGIVTWEVAWKVGEDVLEVIIPNKALSYLSKYIKPLRKEGIALAVDIAVDRSLTIRGAVKDYTREYRDIGERSGRRLKKLREWWYKE